MEPSPAPLILIVEDDPAIADLLAEVLRDHGYQTVIAHDATTALEVVETIRPALMTLDLNLPGISGPALLRLIRATQSGEVLPVIVISASAQIEPYVRAEARHIRAKPFDLDVLIQDVAQVLGQAPPLAS